VPAPGTAESSDVPVEGRLIKSYYRLVSSFISMLRHLGRIGVFILAALDSSLLPTLGAVDALTIVLAARHPELWPYYAMCSTAGSVCGASVAYRLSGLGVLHRRIKGAVFDRVTAFLKRFGSLALSLAALLPPPSTTSAFVLSAGATRYRLIAFVLSFGAGRACRLALLAYLASVFGRRLRGEGVVGPHARTSRGFWRCAGAHRVAGVACL
jgi:membrane protein YqaA with SNARE-associated domain